MSEHIVDAADKLRFTVSRIGTLAPLFATSGVFQPVVHVAEQTVIVQAPGTLARLAASAATKRGTATDKPRAVLVIHAASSPTRDAVRTPRPLVVRNPVPQRWTITPIDVARFRASRLFRSPGITANAGTMLPAAGARFLYMLELAQFRTIANTRFMRIPIVLDDWLVRSPPLIFTLQSIRMRLWGRDRIRSGQGIDDLSHRQILGMDHRAAKEESDAPSDSYC